MADFNEEKVEPITINEQKAKNLAYRRLSIRAYHSIEMEAYLSEKGASAEIIQIILTDLRRLGYIDDAQWIENRIRSFVARKYGPKAIAYKLSNLGIAESDFSTQLNLLIDEQQALIKQILRTKYKKKNLLDFKERQKFLAALARKGFAIGEIISAFKNLDKE